MNSVKTKFGLPENVEFCQLCVMSNQRPISAIELQHTNNSKKTTLHFKDGICDACHFIQRKKLIDWQQRENQLEDLCNRHRSNGKHYDCLVPGSGGKDSFYAAHILKYKYGMTPLTVTWAPNVYTSWGQHNFNAWIHAGFDNHLFTPNGKTHRLLTRLAVENIFHPFQAFIIGQKALAAKIAVQQKIPLVFYGENEAEYGNPVADNNSAQRNWKYFTASADTDIYLGGASLKELKEDYHLTKADLQLYMPSDPDQIIKNNIEVHYLGYYLPWHPQGAYYYAVENGGFQPSPERTPGTYSKYNSIDDKIDDLHYYTTYIKFGIGRATYDAAQEIRNEEITREEGIALVKKYDGEFPERFIDELFQYLSISEKEYPHISQKFKQPIMTREYFHHLENQFRSPHLWEKNANETWQLRHAIYRVNNESYETSDSKA